MNEIEAIAARDAAVATIGGTHTLSEGHDCYRCAAADRHVLLALLKDAQDDEEAQIIRAIAAEQEVARLRDLRLDEFDIDGARQRNAEWLAAREAEAGPWERAAANDRYELLAALDAALASTEEPAPTEPEAERP